MKFKQIHAENAKNTAKPVKNKAKTVKNKLFLV